MANTLKQLISSIKQTLQTISDPNPLKPSAPTLSLSTNIKTLLENGIAEFWYWKDDGSLRFAIGTRDKQIINEYTSWSWHGPAPTTALPYFDIQRNEWRSFIPRNFVKTTEFTPKADLYD